MDRRNFIVGGSQAGLVLAVFGLYACKQQKKEGQLHTDAQMEEKKLSEPFFKLSLAQWSIHRMIREEGLDPYAFAEKAAGWGFSGLEYVSQLYAPILKKEGFSTEAMQRFVDRSNEEAKKYGLQNLIIMVDGEGDLASPDKKERGLAVENHKKWVDAARQLGCHSIRVNLNGTDNPEEWVANSVKGLASLAAYAKDKAINILVENHGGLSSNAALLVEVMKKVDMDNCGTLPDFGNFCIKRGPSNSGCSEAYDAYKGTEELMPFAKAVSAKSHDFDNKGSETKIDYAKMLNIVKKAGYSGFIGVEYEGNRLSEEEGIKATKELLLNAVQKVEE